MALPVDSDVHHHRHSVLFSQILHHLQVTNLHCYLRVQQRSRLLHQGCGLNVSFVAYNRSLTQPLLSGRRCQISFGLRRNYQLIDEHVVYFDSRWHTRDDQLLGFDCHLKPFLEQLVEVVGPDDVSETGDG